MKVFGFLMRWCQFSGAYLIGAHQYGAYPDMADWVPWAVFLAPLGFALAAMLFLGAVVVGTDAKIVSK